MADQTVAWPVKTRDMQHYFFDSRHWDDLRFRDDDIVIATYAKSGTTWMQQIVSQLIFNGAEDVNVHQLSPWYDFRLYPPEVRQAVAAQTHRRFVKTHLPVDALVFSPKAKYIYIGRDGRDTAWSCHNHHCNLTDEVLAQFNGAMPEGTPRLEPCHADPHEYYRTWLARDGFPFWPYWTHVSSWWAIRNLPNVMLIHFNDLKTDLAGSVRRIAQFLDIAVEEDSFPMILDHCSFDYMKAHAAKMAPRGGASFKGGADAFIHKGTNGRWRDLLTAEEIAAYEARAVAELGPDCARWLAEGGPIPD